MAWTAAALGLRGHRLEALVQAPGHLLWVVSREGVFRYDGPARLVPLAQLQGIGMALPPVFCSRLLFIPDGQLWIGTAAGAFRFDAQGVQHAVPWPAPGRNQGSVAW